MILVNGWIMIFTLHFGKRFAFFSFSFFFFFELFYCMRHWKGKETELKTEEHLLKQLTMSTNWYKEDESWNYNLDQHCEALAN